MKSFAVASVLLAAVAVAQPHGHQHRRHHEQHHEKRALVTHVEWVTETQYVTKLVDSTTTVWVSSGSEAEPTSTTEQAQFIETPKKAHKQKPTTTSTTSTSVYVAPVEPTTTSTTSTSIYVAPPPSSTSVVEEVEQPTTTSVYVPPTTTSVYVPPTTTSVYVAPTTTKEEAVAATSASSDESSGGSGGSYSGDITYFTIGRGSCGDDDSGLDDSVAVVALSAELMTSSYAGNPNANPNCGKTITISANGKSTTAVVKDTCPECALGSIDVSEKVFNTLFGGLGKGRGDCSWSFN